MRITEKILAAKAADPEAALVTAPMADPDRVTDLLVALRGTNIHLAGVSVQEPTLDEVFLTLTGTPNRRLVSHERARKFSGCECALKNRIPLRTTAGNSLTMAYRSLLLIRGLRSNFST